MRQTSSRCTVSPEYKAVASLDDALSLLRKVVHTVPCVYMRTTNSVKSSMLGDDDDAQDILEQGLTEANRLVSQKPLTSCRPSWT